MNGRNFRHCNYLMWSDCLQESPFEHFRDLDVPLNVTEWSVVVGVTNGKAQAKSDHASLGGKLCVQYARDVQSLGGREGGRRRKRGREREAGAKAGVSTHHALGISYLKFSHRKKIPAPPSRTHRTGTHRVRAAAPRLPAPQTESVERSE